MNADIDFAVGSDENDYEIKIRRDRWDKRYTYGNIFYIKNTEFGGIIGRKKINTEKDTISLYGRTWRGKLDKKIIRPPEGQDYRKVSGELNAVLNTIVTEQFDRYCTLLTGIIKMLKSVGYKLHIEYIQQERGQPGYVELSAVPIVDYSDAKELSQDSRLNFVFDETKNGVNHRYIQGYIL